MFFHIRNKEADSGFPRNVGGFAILLLKTPQKILIFA
jgi:hypothetical protein